MGDRESTYTIGSEPILNMDEVRLVQEEALACIIRDLRLILDGTSPLDSIADSIGGIRAVLSRALFSEDRISFLEEIREINSRIIENFLDHRLDEFLTEYYES